MCALIGIVNVSGLLIEIAGMGLMLLLLVANR